MFSGTPGKYVMYNQLFGNLVQTHVCVHVFSTAYILLTVLVYITFVVLYVVLVVIFSTTIAISHKYRYKQLQLRS